MLELLFWDYRPYLQDALVIVLAISALLFGGGPERAAIATWLIVFELGEYLSAAVFGMPRVFESIDIAAATREVIAGMCWIAIALYANRSYTLWIAAFQILAICSHLARGLVEAISPLGYAVTTVAPGWFQLLVMAFGLGFHIRRKRKFGAYRDWRFSRFSKRDRSDQERAVLPADIDELTAAIASDTRTLWRGKLK